VNTYRVNITVEAERAPGAPPEDGSILMIKPLLVPAETEREAVILVSELVAALVRHAIAENPEDPNATKATMTARIAAVEGEHHA